MAKRERKSCVSYVWWQEQSLRLALVPVCVADAVAVAGHAIAEVVVAVVLRIAVVQVQ